MRKFYLETRQAVYYRHDNGMVAVDYKGWYSTNCICKVSNDAEGWNYIQTVIKPKYRGKYRLVYRCPKNGARYGAGFHGFSRRGQIRKSDALVIDVRHKA